MITEEKPNEQTTEEKPNEQITEEKTIEEMVIEEDKQEIIENYIEHIRNISELADDEIESILDEVIEEDEELLNILRKFLEKREKIREKVSIELETRGDEDRVKTEKKEEIDDMLEAFDDPDYAYPLEDIIKSLKESGYEDPGTVIVDAISDDILYVDSIDDDEIIYLALTEEGDSLWELRNN